MNWLYDDNIRAKLIKIDTNKIFLLGKSKKNIEFIMKNGIKTDNINLYICLAERTWKSIRYEEPRLIVKDSEDMLINCIKTP